MLRSETARDRAAPPWLPLLQDLTRTLPDWAVWKNVDRALAGMGDVDSVAPPTEWPTIARAFARWAREHDLGPVVACTHIPVGIELIAVPAPRTAFIELGAKARRIYRGSTVYTASAFLPLMEMDPRGFRRLRPGAEGLFKLLLGGVHRDGTPDPRALTEKRAPALIAEDPEGARRASALLGVAGPAAFAAATAAARGEWDRPAMLVVQAWALARAPLDPMTLARKIDYQIRVRSRCPILRVLFREHRQVPADRDAWLAEVRRTHDAIDADHGG
ncbi:MAG: hypothetical protein KGJ98_04210 [Chloroflexota bacterium]|nr:hypothetical protein [Chloroflexota bacterium]